MKKNKLFGEKYGRLTVLGVYDKDKKQNLRWLCACMCGGYCIAHAYDLKNGRIKSCGCLIREGTHKTHGMGRSGKKRSKIYSIWAAMLQRCNNPKDVNYFRYGGRGITVCQRWKKFENFYSDMGDKPLGLSLERIDNDLGYSKDNCKWATVEEQSVNKRNTVRVHIGDNKLINLAVACEMLDVGKDRVYYWKNKYKCSHQQAIDICIKRKNGLKPPALRY